MLLRYVIKVARVDSLKTILRDYFAIKDDDTITEIELDLSPCIFLRSNFTAVFGGILKLEKIKGKEIFVRSPLNKKVETILSKNNFLPSLFPHKFAKIVDNYGTVIEHNKMEIDDNEALEKFMDYFSYDLLVKRGLNDLSEPLLKKIIQKIYELFVNSFIHSKSITEIYSAGQFFPSENKMYFTIVDMGVGIKDNVNKFNGTTYNGYEAIEWALQESHGTTGEGGLGLSLLKDLILQSDGKLEIVSDDGFYQINNKIIRKETMHNKFDGTIINIVFNTNQEEYTKKEI